MNNNGEEPEINWFVILLGALGLGILLSFIGMVIWEVFHKIF